ncbi:glycosyltransferase [Patescibacteria group bacterium]|nr:glycosyltransferase [Patescibacteria group bacterium]MBU1473095.1 glycosyltransferase [Patescibacteria group bacterium]MBU2459632.1 glycosyltransferase [Patescibacteria group bacterium]MBU2544465.1 glycosyltransferase [Patescibacteria group bacterium]
MTISVVIPTFNEEKYLPTTLRSLQKLDTPPSEIIVVDGMSTDKTAEIAGKMGAKVLRVPHRGIGFARQKGLEIVKSEITAYTDADTVVPADWLTKIHTTLSSPGVVGVFGTFRVPSGWWVYRFWVNTIQQIANQILYWLGILMAAGQNMAFKTDAGRAVGGFPPEFKIAEDLEMMRRLKSQGNVIFRQDLVVLSSGRRGNEGPVLLWRIFKAFTYYFLFRRADKIGFPDIR